VARTLHARFDFFQMSFLNRRGERVTDSAVSMSQLFQTIAETPDLQASTGIDEGIRLHRLTSHVVERQSALVGEVVRIRMGNIPPIMGVEGTETEIALTDNQGLAERTGFVYAPSLQVLCYHHNRQGVSVTKFLNLLAGALRYLGHDDLHIQASIVLEPNAWEKVEAMTRIRKFEIGLATPTNGGAFREYPGPLSELSRIRNTTHAARVRVTVSMGRKRGALDKANILEQITSALQIRSQAAELVTRLYVSGGDDEVVDDIDLLKYKLITKDSMEYGGRSITSAELERLCLSAFRKRRALLEAQFVKES
jgi:hypothetical protein